MGYIIKYEDMYSLLWDFKRDMDHLKDTVDNYKSALDSYLNTSAMSGQTADAVYNYFQEVHYVFLDSIKQIAQAFLDNFAGYKAGYYSIDPSTKFVLDEDGIEATVAKLADIYEIFADESTKVNSAISDIDSIDGVEHYDAPGDQGIPTSHDNLNTKLTELDTNISDFESNTVTSIDNSIETLMALFIKSLESLFVPSQVEPNRYVAGTFGENPYAAAEIYMNELLQENHDSNIEILDAIWDQETELHKMAEDRKVMGIWKAVGGGVLIVVGALCIVATCGAGTPLVLGIAGGVAGGGTAIFGTVDLIEGGQDIYHGSTGDLETKSYNFVKDKIFRGNEKVYGIVEEVFSFAAGAMIPIGGAYKVGKLTWRSGGVIFGQEVLAEGAGHSGSYIAGKFTDNEKIKMLAGLSASILVGKAGTMADKRFNLSGLYPKPVNLKPSALNAVPDSRRPAVINTFSDAPDEFKTIINKLSKKLKVGDCPTYIQNGVLVEGVCHYDPVDDIIRMKKSYIDDEYADIFRHEYGHFADAKMGDLSSGNNFINALNSDISNIQMQQMLDDLVSSGAIDDICISDILSGSFNNDPRIINRYNNEGFPYYMHDNNYWNGTAGPAFAREKETFANLFSIFTGSGNSQSISFMEKFFPSTTSTFKDLIKKGRP